MSKLAPGALVKTLVACAVIEALIVGVLYMATGSLAGAVILSILAFGPISVFVAAPVYRWMARLQ